MKKISLLLIFILVLSVVPFVVSQDGADDVDDSDDSRSALERRLQRDLDRGRDIVQDRVRRAPEALRQVRGARDVQVRKLIDRAQVMDIRKRLSLCKTDDAADCDDVRKDAKLKIKNSLLKVGERAIDALTKLRDRIDDEEGVSEIDDVISKLESSIDTIENFEDDTSREDIKAAISKVREGVNEAKEIFKKYHKKSNINENRLRNAINRFEKLSEKIGNRLDRFEERGHDFSELKSLLDEMDSAIDAAKDSLDDDKEGALENLRVANELLHKILKDFRANIERDDNVEEKDDEMDDELEDKDETQDVDEAEENDEDEEDEDEDDQQDDEEVEDDEDSQNE